jgi:dockerin type I repeat protein
VTIDSIWFNGSGNAQIYLDYVSHNEAGLLAASAIIGDYNGDGSINTGDYNAWRSTLGNAVSPGTKADGDGNGIVDTGDFLIWRKLMSLGGTTSITANAAVPEPTALLLVIMALLPFAASRLPLAVRRS